MRVYLTAQRTAHFTRAEVALTNAADSNIAHTVEEKVVLLLPRQENSKVNLLNGDTYQ